MPSARIYHTVGVIDGKLYVVGGYNASFVSALEIYDPVTNEWTTGAPIPTVRHGLAAGVIDGKLFVVGGYGGTDVVEIYDPVTNTWTTGPSMPTGRSGLAASVIDGKLYVVGGSAAGGDQSVLEILGGFENSPKIRSTP